MWLLKFVCYSATSLAAVRNDVLDIASYLFLCPRLQFVLMMLVTEVTFAWN